MADAHPDPSGLGPLFPAPVPPWQPVVLGVSGGGGHCGRWVEPGQARRCEHDAVTPTVHCQSFAPGHNVHQIQGRMGLQSPSRLLELVDVVHPFVIVRDGAGLTHHWWLHDTDAVLAAVLLGETAVHLHEHSLARIDHTLFYPHRDEATPPKPCL